MDDRAQQYQLSVTGIPGYTLYKEIDVIEVESGGVMELPVRLWADEAELEVRSSDVVFELVATDDAALTVTEDARLLGPQ